MIINLLENSQDALKEIKKPKIKIFIKKKVNEVQVVVEDNGIGRKKSQELKTENQKALKSTGIKNIDVG